MSENPLGHLYVIRKHLDGAVTVMEEREMTTDNRLYLASRVGELARDESVVKITLEWKERGHE